MITKNKSKAYAIALLMTFLILATSITVLPATQAHTPSWNIPTYAYISVAPHTVGMGQYVEITMWLNALPPTAQGIEGDRWNGLTVNVTKPDGSHEILGPYQSDAVGTKSITYTPDQVGQYTYVFSFPGQIAGNGTGLPNPSGLAYVGDYFEPSISAPAILTVQQEPISSWVEPPLPTDYWTLPISAANREWSSLASNWLGGSWLVGNWQTEGQAPNSAHILWAKPIGASEPGGIADAQWPSVPPNVDDYESFFSSPIIMNGKIYYNTPQVANTQHYGFYCQDLYTGQILWYNNNTYAMQLGAGPPAVTQTFPTLAFGQMYHYNSVNGQGVVSYLWMTQGTNWYMLDAETGNLILTLKNVPSGTAITDQDGSLLRFSYNSATGSVLCWNSSQSIPPLGPGYGTNGQQWKPRLGTVIDAVNDTTWTTFGVPPGSTYTAADIAPRSGYTINCSAPKGLPGSVTAVLCDKDRVPRVILGSQTGALGTNTGGVEKFSAWALSINYGAGDHTPTNFGESVSLLWSNNYNTPATGNQTMLIIGQLASYEDDVWTVNSKETDSWWGYSLSNGSLLWSQTSQQNPWEMFGSVYRGAIAYGNVYGGQFGGTLYALQLSTGKILWNYTATSVGYESPYGNNPIAFSGAIAFADGKVYFGCTEHSPTKPLERGFDLYCLNATTGQELWKILHYHYGISIADGYLVAGDEYNNLIDCFGKGPTQTTLQTPLTGITEGQAFTVQGTVMDISPGASQTSVKDMFPNGLPAVSEDSMSQWMEYVYLQQAFPANTTGVPVSIIAIDPNGNYINLGSTTTDSSGSYGFQVSPSMLTAGPGLYKIVASFTGSTSYGSSHATSFVTVNAAPTSPTATPLTQIGVTPADLLTYLAVGVIAIIIAIAIATVLLLRKRP